MNVSGDIVKLGESEELMKCFRIEDDDSSENRIESDK